MQEPQLEAMKGHLIALVKDKRALWSSGENFYKNKAIKTNDWQSVYEKMKEKYGGLINKHKMSTPDEIRKMWHSLRNYYRINLRKVSGPGTSGKGATGKVTNCHKIVIILGCTKKTPFFIRLSQMDPLPSNGVSSSNHTRPRWSVLIGPR